MFINGMLSLKLHNNSRPTKKQS